jgi:type III secretion protein Q
MDKQNSVVGKGVEESDLASLPVNVVFELGRMEMPLSEVQRLAAGAVVPLMRPFGDAVDIVANGRRIGKAVLVKVGDAISVRITRLNDLV